MDRSEISVLRRAYHRAICENILCKQHKNGIDYYNMADVGSKASVDIANRIVRKIEFQICEGRVSPQTSGSLFAQYTLDFLNRSFSLLRHLRPGEWEFSADQGSGILAFDQYDHIAQLDTVLNEYESLKATFGGDYIIIPDITVARIPVADEEINKNAQLVSSDNSARLTPIRASNFRDPRKILHASISCKWTMRSDRAQNTRTEALNLIRLRKGRTPIIAAVTIEPLPTRIASLALGTGDIDCTYHAALNELSEAVEESEREDQAEMIQIMIKGRRLRDISDLPFDLIS